MAGRGKDEGDRGSNAGSNDGAGRLTPATGATGKLPLLGEDFFLSIAGLCGQVPAWRWNAVEMEISVGGWGRRKNGFRLERNT